MPHTLGSVYKALCTMLGEVEARIILAEEVGLTWADIIGQPDTRLTTAQTGMILDCGRRVAAGEPVSRIYSRREFYGVPFKISAETLDPRPETEHIIDIALQRFDKDRGLRILDLGTGSGCILLTLLHHFPNAYGWASDISEAALRTAGENAAHLKLGGRARFVCAHWTKAIAGRFDLIVSNPPYIRSAEIESLDPAVLQNDPLQALDGGEDGVQAYKDIFCDLKSLLTDGGTALFEIGFDQAEIIKRLSTKAGLRLKDVHADYAGWPRVVEIFSGDK